MKISKLYLGNAGYCTAKGSHAVKGDPREEIEFGALFGLIQHPDKGWILFDTGYTDRFFTATKSYPDKIYAKMTKVFLKPEDEVKAFIQSFGLQTGDIKYVIISHFHGDHVAGLRDFDQAAFYCSKTAYEQVKKISNFWAFSKGILKDLLPDDFENRLQFVDDIAEKKADSIFGTVYDLFHDDSIVMTHLPGHAAGQMGVQLQTEKNNYFLVADACWNIRAITENAMPNPIVKLFFDSWSDYRESIEKIKQFHQQFPEIKIVPTHCSTTTAPLISTNHRINEL